MSFVEILKILAAVSTTVVGLVVAALPRSVSFFTGIAFPENKSVTEIRAALGGVFIGLGLAPFVLGAPAAYEVLGLVYAIIAGLRVLSMIIDDAFVPWNFANLFFEVLFAVLLLAF